MNDAPGPAMLAAAEVLLRWLVPVLLLALGAGCDRLLVEERARIAALEAENAALAARLEVVEARLAALEAAEATPPVPTPPPVAPVPRPLVVPVAPVPPPAPAKPEGPVGRVQVAAPRHGLAIWVNGVERAETTPALLELPPGRYTVKVEGYTNQTVSVETNETVMVVPR